MSEKLPVQLIVRPAKPMDTVNIVRLLSLSWSRSPVAQISPVDEKRAFEYVCAMLPQAFMLVAEVSGRIIGSICIAPMQHPWSTAQFMGQVWFVNNGSIHSKRASEEMLNYVRDFLDAQEQPALFRMNEVDHQLIGNMAKRFERGEFCSLGAFYIRWPQERDDAGKSGTSAASNESAPATQDKPEKVGT